MEFMEIGVKLSQLFVLGSLLYFMLWKPVKKTFEAAASTVGTIAGNRRLKKEDKEMKKLDEEVANLKMRNLELLEELQKDGLALQEKLDSLKMQKLELSNAIASEEGVSDLILRPMSGYNNQSVDSDDDLAYYEHVSASTQH